MNKIDSNVSIGVRAIVFVALKGERKIAINTLYQ
jgi:hypothetical protein